MKQDNSDSL